MRKPLVLSLQLLVCATVCVLVVSAYRARPAAGEIPSPEEAISLASSYTGLPYSPEASAVERVVSDPSSPLLPIENLPVWEVSYEGVTLAFPQQDGSLRENRDIHSMRVWIDRQSGALLKVFSPVPRQGGLRLLIPPEENGLLETNGVSLKTLAVAPEKPLLSTLVLSSSGLSASVPQAREIVAYFGLFSKKLPVNEQIIDRPAWLVYLGGINQAFSSRGPFGAAQSASNASEMVVALDATTGQRYVTFLAGGPVAE